MGSTVPSSRRCRLGLGQAARKLLASWAERTGSLEVKRSREIDQFHTQLPVHDANKHKGGHPKNKTNRVIRKRRQRACNERQCRTAGQTLRRPRGR